MTGEPIVQPAARVVRVHDADTYLLLLDLHARGLDQDGCETAWVRLRDFSARELSDTASADPLGFGRVDGPAAQKLAVQAFTAARVVSVELKGADGVGAVSFGRYVGWVWVDGVSLGAMLAAVHAVAPGGFEGLR